MKNIIQWISSEFSLDLGSFFINEVHEKLLIDFVENYQEM
jgi:hypothetical protein